MNELHTIPALPAIGDEVITRLHGTPIRWAGESDTPGIYTVSFGVDASLRASIADVAPADAPPADPKDPRIVVANDRAGRPGSWVPGPWRVQTPGTRVTWHKTKRDAVAYGVSALTVEDWHAARAASAAELEVSEVPDGQAH